MEATTAEKAAEEHSFLIRSSTNENAFILVKESEANRPVLVASLIKYVAEYTSLYSSAPSELAGLKSESIRLSLLKEPPYLDIGTFIEDIKAKNRNVTCLWYHIEKPDIKGRETSIVAKKEISKAKQSGSCVDEVIEVVITTNTPLRKVRSKSVSYSSCLTRKSKFREDNSESSDSENDSGSDSQSFTITKEEKDEKQATSHHRKSKRLINYYVSEEIQQKVLEMVDKFDSMSTILVVEGFPNDLPVKSIKKILIALRIGRFAEIRRHPQDPSFVLLICDSRYTAFQKRGEIYTITDKLGGSQFNIQFKTLNKIATTYETLFHGFGY